MLVIEGMENCIIKDNVNIKISGYENIIREIRLKEIETGKAELEIYFIEKYFKNNAYDDYNLYDSRFCCVCRGNTGFRSGSVNNEQGLDRNQ